MPKLLQSKLTYTIIGLCFRVHTELGRFSKEKQYADRLEQLLLDKGLSYQREQRIPFIFNTASVSGNIVDFSINECLLVDCKAKPFITKADYAQMQRYLQASKIELGMIVNFHQRFLTPKRVLNYSLHKKFGPSAYRP